MFIVCLQFLSAPAPSLLVLHRGMTPASRWSQGFHASTSDVSNFPMDIDDADGGSCDCGMNQFQRHCQL
eukprot:6277716-Amphidinium_carterae.1